MPARLITLTTDFGLRDPFVGIMKGVILGICPGAQLVDLTHELDPQDVFGAAVALDASVRFFPSGAIHLAVVDPGVGTARRAMALYASGHYFVGPDNGLFSFALREGGWSAVSLEEPALRLGSVSRTFHGRDIFAPAAAHLAAGVPLGRFGPPIVDPVRLAWPDCRREADALVGEVIGTDRFGNLLTNVGTTALQALGARDDVSVWVAGSQLGPVLDCYAAGEPGTPAPIVGSTGRLEIFVPGGSAAALLDVGRGTPVKVYRLR